MKSKIRGTAVAAGTILWVGFAGAAQAQAAEVKEKPPMYTYVAEWTVPRTKWAEVDKQNATESKMFDKLLAAGTIVGFGNDTTIVHSEEGSSHDGWWSAMSMAALVNTLEEVMKGGPANSYHDVATKHSDHIYVSRFYNWHPGAAHGVYTHTAVYKLKADAPDDAVDTLSKSFIVPLLEKLIADGSLLEYEIDQQAIHTEAPGTFSVVFIAAKPDALDKVNAELAASVQANPFISGALGSMLDGSGHRDGLYISSVTYK